MRWGSAFELLGVELMNAGCSVIGGEGEGVYSGGGVGAGGGATGAAILSVSLRSQNDVCSYFGVLMLIGSFSNEVPIGLNVLKSL